jgi:uncharacterized protein (DUF2062 family)
VTRAESPRRARRRALRAHAKTAWRRLRGGEVTPARAAASVAIGLAIGVTPLWGVHWLIVLAICLPLRLDAGVAFLASNISLPFIAPFITFAELEVGARIVRGAWLAMKPEDVRGLTLGRFVTELVVGTVLVAIGSSAIGGSLTYAFVGWRARAAR